MKKVAVACSVALALSVSGAVLAADGDDKNTGFRYDNGLRFDTEDGAFSFTLTNRVQVGFTQEDPDDGASVGSFRLRRWKFKMAGHVFTYWKYQLQLNFAGQGTQSADVDNGEVTLGQDDVLEDAFFQYTKHHWVQPWMGQGKTKFGRERLTSSGKLIFVDRALLSAEAEVPRDIGFALVGFDKNEKSKDRKFEYNVGIYNGNALNQKENDNDKYAYTARVVWTPFGTYDLVEGALDYPDTVKMAVGLDYYSNTLTDDTDTDFDVRLYGPEFALKIKGFYAQFEYYMVDVDVVGGGAGKIDTGYWQASWLMPNRKAEFAGRVSIVDPDTAAEAVTNESINSSLGFNYYLAGFKNSDGEHSRSHNFKVQTDLTREDDRSADNEDQWVFRAQVQFAF